MLHTSSLVEPVAHSCVTKALKGALLHKTLQSYVTHFHLTPVNILSNWCFLGYNFKIPTVELLSLLHCFVNFSKPYPSVSPKNYLTHSQKCCESKLPQKVSLNNLKCLLLLCYRNTSRKPPYYFSSSFCQESQSRT